MTVPGFAGWKIVYDAKRSQMFDAQTPVTVGYVRIFSQLPNQSNRKETPYVA